MCSNDRNILNLYIKALPKHKKAKLMKHIKTLIHEPNILLQSMTKTTNEYIKEIISKPEAIKEPKRGRGRPPKSDKASTPVEDSALKNAIPTPMSYSLRSRTKQN